jgi:hypothetical protein
LNRQRRQQIKSGQITNRPLPSGVLLGTGEPKHRVGVLPLRAASQQPGKVLRLVFLEVLLTHEERLESPRPIVGRSIGTPLLQPLPLQRIVEVFPALCFDDPDFRVGALDQKVRVVIGDAPVCVSVFHAELRDPRLPDALNTWRG